MLEILIEKKLLFPLILFVAVYAAIEISYYRGYAAGTAEEKEKQEKVIQEFKSLDKCVKLTGVKIKSVKDVNYEP